MSGQPHAPSRQRMDSQINPQSVPSGTSIDLRGALTLVHAGRFSATALLEQSLAAAASPVCQHAFIRRFDEQARVAAAAAVSYTHLTLPTTERV